MAHAQSQPQCLLFVFTRSDLPEDCNETEIERFNAGIGGHLIPVICVDKSLDQISNFTDLVEESKNTDQDWKIVFVAALSGTAGILPTAALIEQALNSMVESIQQGLITNYIAFDREGQVVQFQ